MGKCDLRKATTNCAAARSRTRDPWSVVRDANHCASPPHFLLLLLYSRETVFLMTLLIYRMKLPLLFLLFVSSEYVQAGILMSPADTRPGPQVDASRNPLPGDSIPANGALPGTHANNVARGDPGLGFGLGDVAGESVGGASGGIVPAADINIVAGKDQGLGFGFDGGVMDGTGRGVIDKGVARARVDAGTVGTMDGGVVGGTMDRGFGGAMDGGVGGMVDPGVVTGFGANRDTGVAGGVMGGGGAAIVRDTGTAGGVLD